MVGYWSGSHRASSSRLSALTTHDSLTATQSPSMNQTRQFKTIYDRRNTSQGKQMRHTGVRRLLCIHRLHTALSSGFGEIVSMHLSLSMLACNHRNRRIADPLTSSYATEKQ